MELFIPGTLYIGPLALIVSAFKLEITLVVTSFGGIGDWYYRPGTVNSKSFDGKVFLLIKWKFELILHLIGKHFTEMSQKL